MGIILSFLHPYPSAQSFGLEYIDGYLWFSTVGTSGTSVYLCRINPETHEYDIVYRLTDVSYLWGICYDGDYLWGISSGTTLMQAYDLPDLQEDNDGDGLTTQEESDCNTNPNDADTDNDNLGDGVEIRLNLDPNNWDSDGDGIGDGLEFIANFGGNSSAQSLPDGFIRMTIQWEDSFAIITTNSTMLSASFNRTGKELEFNAEGPTGTISFCNVTFPQSLISNINNLKVKVDDNQIAFNYTISDNMVKISFVYANSEHIIKV